MSWDEEAGQVSRAFDEWKMIAADIRALLELTERWVNAAYQSTWADAEAEFAAVFDPDRHDVDGHVDVFHTKVLGLWDKDYFWMARSGALRDLVTAFEVYAEKSLNEALSPYRFEAEDGDQVRLGLAVNKHHESPAWPTLVAVHGAFGNKIDTANIRYIRALRHVLTHQRGELRTEEQRLRFAGEGDASDWRIGEARVGGDVPLSKVRVIEMMDQVDAAARAMDPAIWKCAWAHDFPPAVLALAQEKGSPLIRISV